MIKRLAKSLFITFLILSCSNFCYAKVFDYLSLNTAPVTLTPAEKEEIYEEHKTVQNVETNIPVTVKSVNKEQQTPNKKNIKPLSYINTKKQQSLNTKQSSEKKIKPLEIVDFDVKGNTIKTNDSESFLLVPIDKEQLKQESEKSQYEELTTSLIKDSPKPLTVKSKLISNFSSQSNSHKKSKIWIIKFIIKIFIILFVLLIVGFLGYFVYRKRVEEQSIKEKVKNLTYEEEKRHELIQALEEFEKTEEKHKKLGHKVYINELETYKNLDGFKVDEVSDDIIKTMETIEKAQKNEIPLHLKENSNNGFKKNNYVFENELGTLSDEEGIALFDENDENNFSTEEEFLNPDYYSENYEITNKTSEQSEINKDIFIIEDVDSENEEDNTYKIVEEQIPEQQSEEKNEDTEENIEIVENTENVEQTVTEIINTPEPKVSTKEQEKPSEPKLEIKEKYPLDDSRGFALLKYKNTVALIGYIEESITVLKRFSKQDNAENLSVRIYEELSDKKAQYLVRVGKYKGIVEFDESTIKLVLNL